jgi:hypothetical protein
LIDLRGFELTIFSIFSSFLSLSSSFCLSILLLLKFPLFLFVKLILLLVHSTFLSFLEFISLFIKVYKLIMDKLNLNWTKSESFSIDQTFYRV